MKKILSTYFLFFCFGMIIGSLIAKSISIHGHLTYFDITLIVMSVISMIAFLTIQKGLLKTVY